MNPNKTDDGGVRPVQTDYLNATDTAGRPMALVSMIIIILLIIALTWGAITAGRWIYNELTNDNGQTSSDVAVNEEADKSTEQGQNEQGSDEASAPGGAGNGTETGEQGDTVQNGQQGSTNGESQNDQESSDRDSGIPSTGVDEEVAEEELPETGAGSLVGIFVATTATATIAYQIVLRRKAL